MAKTSNQSKPIRVGVVGVGRGQTFMDQAAPAGMELVAICDTWEAKLREVGERLGVATYVDFEKFLTHDMDAVVTANYFHEHAPLAIRALEAGLHVMSECSACKTMAEAVALCEAVEKSDRQYMFAENYPYTAFNMEMQRLYHEGQIGTVMYAEGEYIHPMSPETWAKLSPGLDHWRNNVPSTYYCTHALGPLMVMTDTMPTSVNALSIATPECPEFDAIQGVRTVDPAAVMLCRMDNGAVFRLVQIQLGGHSCWYRLHGTRGLIENDRSPGYFGSGMVREVHESWDLRQGDVHEKRYLPAFPDWAKGAATSGHGGSDFVTNYLFAESIRTGQPPYLDVYRGAAMSVVGIQGWRSALAEGASQEIPDFHSATAREPYRDDHWSPYPQDAGPGQPPRSIRGTITPSPEALARARKVWKDDQTH